MKPYTILIAVCMASAAHGCTRPANEPKAVDSSPTAASESERQGSEPLTTEQVGLVKQILSRYDAASLEEKDAQAIHAAFREAGLRGGPALNQAVQTAGFDPDRLRVLDPPPAPPNGSTGPQRGVGHHRYSVEQATSNRAQLSTIAFDGLAFLTGDMACNTFLPPGKVADFNGFQYMRDVDTNELGHNTSFVPRVADNVLYVLTAKQKAELIALAKEQEPVLAEFAHKRFPLIQAFHRELTGSIPAGSAGLNREAVMEHTSKLYELDGLLSYRRAEVLGSIVRSLTDEQKEYLGKMVFTDSSTWPELKDQVDKRSMSHAAHVAVMTYASEMFSWYAGNVEADVYFCPERHATYFGAFYMKDIPAMGNPNYNISTALTGDAGEAFLNTLTKRQRVLVTSLVDQQRADLMEIVRVRREMATLLRGFQNGANVDEKRAMALSRRYGALDGEISYLYAKAFAAVARTLTSDQKTALLKLRNLDAKYACKSGFLFSAPIDMPTIPNTDFLFAASASAKKSASLDANPRADVGQGSFRLTSPAVDEGGMLPRDFTGDGSAATLPLGWTGAPAGTRSFAIIMHHIAPDRTKWYWILYNIPAATMSLPRNVGEGVGTLGNNSVNGRAEYAPPHSRGPGPKTYEYTLYALSAPVTLDVGPARVSRDVLLAAMAGKILGTAKLRVVYSRGQ